MPLLTITQYPSPILRAKGEAVEKFDDSLKQLADDMIATCRANKGDLYT
jgi:peptide deformylase